VDAYTRRTMSCTTLTWLTIVGKLVPFDIALLHGPHMAAAPSGAPHHPQVRPGRSASVAAVVGRVTGVKEAVGTVRALTASLRFQPQTATALDHGAGDLQLFGAAATAATDGRQRTVRPWAKERLLVPLYFS